ncbi:uncharacterized protein LOC124192838 [Daphnia pulex]|uniref:uncharacterized protein LOC124192838 n=1 Tax=Daphnia pulex TaxID=6669 RepID=UPI001EE0415F|nr:uncharacterized protein LOC124192838 [Daphnia pulex]
MDRLMALRRIFPLVAVLLFAANGCLSQKPTAKDSLCSKEMCVFLFGRLEEQSIRLHNIEDALMRTVSILASVKDQEFSTASAALKSDPLLNSLFTADAYGPVESTLLRSDQMTNSLQSPVKIRRRKRQTGERSFTPRERLREALKRSKKSTTSFQMRSDQSEKLNDVSQVRTEHQIIQDSKLHSVHSHQFRDESEPLANASIYSRSNEEWKFFNISNNNTDLLRHACETSLVGETTIFQFVKDAVGDLQNAVKCAVGQFNDEIPSESLGVLFEPQATLNPNKTLTIQFELKNCQKYWAAVWIRISLRNEQANRKSILKIPKDCMMKSENVFSLTLPLTDESSCMFPLVEMIECKVYSVEIIPVYLTLQGQSSSVEITVPPEVTGYSMDLVSFERISLQNSTHILGLKWTTQSEDCAQLMTSVDVRIYEDAEDTISRSFAIPTNCVKNGQFQNSFTTTLRHSSYFGYSDNLCTDVTWTPLDICRKYKLELEPEYSSSLRGKSLSLEIYTPGVGDASSCCSVLTSPTGVFQSADYDGRFGCTWLISVEKNFTIWLTFTVFQLESSYYRIKVYDGPHSASPLLLDQSGRQPPHPIRSQSNKLFIQLVPNNPEYYGYNSNGKSFTAHYISVCKDAISNS